ncbi:MAG: hypothetical protein LC664_07875 [Flavobacteriales bacterium]|nr:hypothetical protein [Flavobacteriales bacterium]
METKSEKNRKKKAVIATVLFHLIAFILFFIFGLKQPVPLPEDRGASIEFGWEEDAGGDAVAQTETPQPEPVETAPAVEETAEEVVEEDVVSDDDSDVAVPDQKEEPKPQEKEEEPKEEPAEDPKPTIDDKLKDALSDLSNPDKQGSGQGDTQGQGDQGNPAGKDGKGVLGGGSGSWQLEGRSLMPGYGTKISSTNEEGILVLNITVDRNGNVTKVTPNLRESNTTSQYLINLAKKDVLNNYKFNGDPGAAVEQRGKVRYVFKLN